MEQTSYNHGREVVKFKKFVFKQLVAYLGQWLTTLGGPNQIKIIKSSTN